MLSSFVCLIVDNRISGQIIEFRKYFLCHLTDTVFHKPRIFVRVEHDLALISPFQEFVDATAHRFLKNADDLFEIHMLVVIGLYAEKSPVRAGCGLPWGLR